MMRAQRQKPKSEIQAKSKIDDREKKRSSLVSQQQSTANHESRFQHDFSKTPTMQSAAAPFQRPQPTVQDATRVAHGDGRKLKPVDVNVEDLDDMLSAALDSNTGVMHIVGSGLEYFKNNRETAGIREDFLAMLRAEVRKSKWNSGTLKGTYRAGLTIYGGRMWDPTPENLFSKGTWMVGKNDAPTIDYEVVFRRAGTATWVADWKASWRLRDYLDLTPSSDQSWFYRVVATITGWLWHDAIGGNYPAPVHLDWTESGTMTFGDPPNIGVPIRTLSPGDVRKW